MTTETTPSLADELFALLTEAGTEIYNLDGPNNPVCNRLRQARVKIVERLASIREHLEGAALAELKRLEAQL